MSVLMDNDTGYFPDTPPEGVTPDEWQASQSFSVDKEDPPNSLSLLDLDGDGQRDLIISNGWDSEFTSYTSTWAVRRKGNTFDAITPFSDDLRHALFTTGDNNTTAYWIRLHGRIYAVSRARGYGDDKIYLRRPFVSNYEMPMLTVRYHYQLSVPVEKIKETEDERLDGLKKETALGDEKLSDVLTTALQSMSDKTPSLDIPKTPLCPIPASVKGDDRKRYYALYTVPEPECGDSCGWDPLDGVVGDLSIQAGNKCYIGRLHSKGIYDANGLVDTEIGMWMPGKKDEWEFEVRGTRKAVSVTISTQKEE
jgi:hypothetical protein